MNQWSFRWNLILVVVAILTLTGVGASGKSPEAKGSSKKAKAVDYEAALCLTPLNNAVDINAGTLEVRFSLDYSFDEPLRPEESSCSPFTFLQVYDGSGAPYGPSRVSPTPEPAFMIWLQQWKGFDSISFYNRFYCFEWPRDPAVPGPAQKGYELIVQPNKEKGPWFRAGEWHTLATTWVVEKGALQVEIFIDGVSRSKQSFPVKESAVNPFPKGDFLSIGGLTLSPATILAYRLSNRVRTKEEIMSDKPLTSDEATTFFMNGETAGKAKVMKKEEFDAMRKNKKISIHQTVFIGDMKIVSTPKGKAVQFYKKRSR